MGSNNQLYSNELGIICTVMDIEATQALDFAEYDDETDDEGSGGNDEGSGGNKKPVLRSHLMWLISLCVCTHTNHTKFHILCEIGRASCRERVCMLV